MKTMRIALLASTLLLSACATPVAVSPPPLPPAPSILTESPSTGPSLIERYEITRQKLKCSLEKAQRP